jgi:hypothetical protein
MIVVAIMMPQGMQTAKINVLLLFFAGFVSFMLCV